jgi:high-affinity Fe2+/Pb2+ permease
MMKRILTVVVAALLFSGGVASAQWMEWSRWMVVSHGRLLDRNSNLMDQFTMTSMINLDNGMCVVVLRDTGTGQFSMIEAPGTGNCNE